MPELVHSTWADIKSPSGAAEALAETDCAWYHPVDGLLCGSYRYSSHATIAHLFMKKVLETDDVDYRYAYDFMFDRGWARIVNEAGPAIELPTPSEVWTRRSLSFLADVLMLLSEAGRAYVEAQGGHVTEHYVYIEAPDFRGNARTEMKRGPIFRSLERWLETGKPSADDSSCKGASEVAQS